jgi:hypothetical protein
VLGLVVASRTTPFPLQPASRRYSDNPPLYQLEGPSVEGTPAWHVTRHPCAPPLQWAPLHLCLAKLCISRSPACCTGQRASPMLPPAPDDDSANNQQASRATPDPARWMGNLTAGASTAGQCRTGRWRQAGEVKE